jgi:hypothetical protein
LIWAWWLPINKALWTSSYSLLMAGMAANVFGCCYWLVDIKGYRRWSQPLAIYGMNAITVYVLAGLLAQLSSFIKITGADGSEITAAEWVFEHVYAPLASPVNASLLYALTYVAILYGVSWFNRAGLFEVRLWQPPSWFPTLHGPIRVTVTPAGRVQLGSRSRCPQRRHAADSRSPLITAALRFSFLSRTHSRWLSGQHHFACS